MSLREETQKRRIKYLKSSRQRSSKTSPGFSSDLSLPGRKTAQPHDLSWRQNQRLRTRVPSPVVQGCSLTTTSHPGRIQSQTAGEQGTSVLDSLSRLRPCTSDDSSMKISMIRLSTKHTEVITTWLIRSQSLIKSSQLPSYYYYVIHETSTFNVHFELLCIFHTHFTLLTFKCLCPYRVCNT